MVLVHEITILETEERLIPGADADIAKALEWSYPTTLKKLKSPSLMTVTDAEKLCDLIDLDIIKFIKPF